MSNEALNWAYEQNLKSPQKPVLTALANHANDKDTAWPSVETLAFETGMSKATVMRATKKLEALGLLSKKMSQSPRGHRWFNTYKLHLNINMQASNMQGCTEQDSILVQQPINMPCTKLQDDTQTIIEPSMNHQDIVDLYHEVLTELPKIKVLSQKRRAYLRATLNSYPKARVLSWWQGYFEKVKDAPFLLGQNPRGWRADFEFLIKFDNVLKVIEGKYEKAT
jgi:predicted transcriptional regulator